MKSIIVALAVAALTSCTTQPISQTSLGKLTLSDAQTAAAMAKQAGDTAGAACYTFIAGQIQSQTTTSICGLLCANEVKRTVTTTESNLGQACGGVLPLALGL